MIEKNYAGLDGFVWWMGVVESRLDPLKLGRCRVRIYGWHADSLSSIPSADLPWAHPVHSLNTSSFNTPKESDLVFGFFADGKNAQIPVMLGIIPNLQTIEPNGNLGFNDVRSLEEIKIAPKKPVSRSYSDTGGGVSLGEANTADPEVLESLRYPNSETFNNSSISGLARNEPGPNAVVLTRKRENNRFIKSADGYYFRTPNPAYGPNYPYNEVIETESGHSLEFDDTPTNERVTLSHRSGTTIEMYPSGTKTEEIVKNNYKLVLSDDHVHIMGKAIVTIDSDCLLKINGDVDVEAGNDLNLSVSGSANISVKEDLKIKAKNIILDAEQDFSALGGDNTYLESRSGSNNIKSGQKILLGSSSSIDINGSTINLNSPGTLNPSSATNSSLEAPAERSIKNETQPFVENGPTFFEVIAQDDELPKTLLEYNNILISAGIDPVEQQPIQEGANIEPEGGGQIRNVSCGSIILLDDYSKVRVSPNFTLADFTQNGRRRLQPNRGVSVEEILCNIVNLSENICEPLLSKGFKFKINSCWRRPGDAPGSSDTSDHNFGRALDISVVGLTAFEAARQIYPIMGNIAKQFLLEYAAGPGWIHISYDGGKKHPLPLATFRNHSVYARNRLVDLKPGVRAR